VNRLTFHALALAAAAALFLVAVGVSLLVSGLPQDSSDVPQGMHPVTGFVVTLAVTLGLTFAGRAVAARRVR
jgi:predicted tellurium resistance membrane protein TerC